MTPSAARVERLCETAALTLPLALSACCAGASAGFYDAPELASCAAGIGVTHPPGHPFWVALASLATLIPVGDVPFRVALLSGVAMSLVGWMAYRASLKITQALADHPWMAPVFALSAAMTAVLGPAVMRQATRAEVYALAGMLGVAQILLATETEWPHAARARAAVLLLALGGANHHFIALTTAPLALWTVLTSVQARSGAERRWAHASWVALGAAGLLPYVLLPLRARASASVVRVATAGDFVWTVTARAFQKNTGGGVPGSFAEHLLDVLEWIGTSVSPVGLVAFLGGVWLSLRALREPLRKPAGDVAFRALTVLFFGGAARAALGFVRGNPDAAGYLMPAIVAVAIVSSAFVSGVFRAVRTAPAYPDGPTPAARVVLLALLVALPSLLPVYLAWDSAHATAVDRAFAPERINDALLTPLPQRSVLLAYAPETVFRVRYAQLVEGARPDVTSVEVPFVPWPGMTTALLVRDGALLSLVQDYLAHGEPRIENLAVLASSRPVRLELDPHNLMMMIPWFLPRGVSGEVRAEPTTLAAVRATSAGHFSAYDELARALGESPGAEPRWREFLLWRGYNDAMFFAARGARPEARHALRNALAINPSAEQLRGLDAALAGPGEGPVDVLPFLVGR